MSGPTKEAVITAKRNDGSKLCDLVYPANDFTTSETMELLSGRMYPPLRLKKSPKTIIDIGAAWGDSSVYFATLYPEAHVYAFEPTPESFEYLRRNVEPFKDRIRIYQMALAHGDEEAVIPFYLGDNTTGGVCNTLIPFPNYTRVEVQAIGAAKMLRRLGLEKIDILKVDVEGAEAAIFPDLKDHLPHIPVIYVEYHQESYRRLIDRLLEPSHHLACCRTCGNCEQGELTYVRMDAVTLGQT